MLFILFLFAFRMCLKSSEHNPNFYFLLSFAFGLIMSSSHLTFSCLEDIYSDLLSVYEELHALDAGEIEVSEMDAFTEIEEIAGMLNSAYGKNRWQFRDAGRKTRLVRPAIRSCQNWVLIFCCAKIEMMMTSKFI